MTVPRLRFGAFLSPLHPPGENPATVLWRDRELAEWLDALGYDELWVGEHHSAGWGLISSPELFLASVAEHTKHLRLATGVVSLPYHHPFMVASRAVQLHHLTRGRFILGVGAGSLPSDMHMLGIDPGVTRTRTAESIETIRHLLSTEEPLTATAGWFELHDARLQLGPFGGRPIELAISSASSPFSMRLAGKHGLSPVSFGAPRPGTDPGNLREQWDHLVSAADEAGRAADRDRWRITLPVHLADSREQAIEDVLDGWTAYRLGYWGRTLGLPVTPPRDRGEARALLAESIASHSAIIGSVEDAVAAIAAIHEVTGGLGQLLVNVQDWAPRAAVLHSFELLARFVIPRFDGSADRAEASANWVADHRADFLAKALAAQQRAQGVPDTAVEPPKQHTPAAR
ncbi:LLM class flavin-dependent oxidoreductase [Amycolatopsis ultiminotia]|uniref:LLM class flavin-dependent oxidoreductase n=1 Tax=Amycolatopsis ultiminotia TaxID=543629 RepID=A0ABP6XHY9_9PSEU